MSRSHAGCSNAVCSNGVCSDGVCSNGVCSAASGFTLIEIVLAITIMGMIAGVVFQQVTKYLKRSRVKTTRLTLRMVQGDVQSFHTDTGSYPESVSELMERPTDEKISRRWDGPYLDKEPTDAWNNELTYVLNPKGAKPPYDLYSWGPSGEGSSEEEWLYATA